jgi:hypothetical protein
MYPASDSLLAVDKQKYVSELVLQWYENASMEYTQNPIVETEQQNA